MSSVYLDHAAATPLRPEVGEVVTRVSAEAYGNPSSVHGPGRTARALLEEARERVARALDVSPDEVRFVRGGTESINLAILGRFALARAEGRGDPLFVRSAVEHSAVREALDELASLGARVETLPLQSDGTIDLEEVDLVLDASPELVSVQWVNQETGIVLPVPEIADRCHAAGVVLHVDAVQAVGRVKVDPDRTPLNLMSLSAHKLGGPRAMGVLVVRAGTELRPILFGGGQEGGIRPGTEDVAGAVGTALALELALQEREPEALRLSSLRDRLQVGLSGTIEGMRVHGASAPRAPHILSIGVPGLPRDLLPGALDLEGIAISAGSACRSGSTTASPVLRALFGDAAEEIAPVRFSLGRTTTSGDIDAALNTVPRVVERMQALGVGA